MGLLKVDNVMRWSIPVNDLAESEKFYGEVLGLTFRGRRRGWLSPYPPRRAFSPLQPGESARESVL